MVTCVWFNNETNPLRPEDGEVIGYHPNWVSEDFNPEGRRVGFIDDDGAFLSANWCNDQDTYFTDLDDTTPPTHWLRIPTTTLIRHPFKEKENDENIR